MFVLLPPHSRQHAGEHDEEPREKHEKEDDLHA
jgi:hypothetical protein